MGVRVKQRIFRKKLMNDPPINDLDLIFERLGHVYELLKRLDEQLLSIDLRLSLLESEKITHHKREKE